MNKRLILTIVGALLLVLLIGKAWYSHALGAGCEGNQTQTIDVDDGDAAKEIAKKLKDKSLINSERAFRWHVRMNSANFKAGLHQVKCGTRAPEIAKELTQQPKDRQFTVQEGLTQRQIAQKVDDAGMADKDDFEDLKVSDFRDVVKYDFLSEVPDNASLEGFLFPETYSAPKLEGLSDDKAKAKEIATIMLNQFGEELTPQLREKIKASGRSIYETVIVASIVEDEVRSDTDRKKVAGIMYRRLREGIRLDADATTRYAVNKPKDPLTKDDLDSDSPYNTRKVKGLPPGPIGNPGLSSLMAAIEPEESEYLFYLSAPDGKTIFAKTLEEHEANVQKYLRS